MATKVKDNKRKKKKKSTLDIENQIKDKAKELFDLKIEHKLGKLKDVNQIKKARRGLARLKTKKNLAEIASESVS